MLPNAKCDPNLNVITIGAKIIKKLKDNLDAANKQTVSELLIELPENLGVSVDHVILSLDWLYAICAIRIDGDEVRLNEIS